MKGRYHRDKDRLRTLAWCAGATVLLIAVSIGVCLFLIYDWGGVRERAEVEDDPVWLREREAREAQAVRREALDWPMEAAMEQVASEYAGDGKKGRGEP